MENKVKDICEGVFIKTEVMIYLTSVTQGYILIQRKKEFKCLLSIKKALPAFIMAATYIFTILSLS